MGFLQAYASFWKNYVNFGGRSSRSAYWWVQLWNVSIFLIFLAVTIGPLVNALATENYNRLGFSIFFIIVYFLYVFAIIIPSISLGVRRFHDANVSAWWYVGLYAIPEVLRLITQFTTKSTSLLNIIVLLISLGTGIAGFVITLLPSKDPNKFREETDC
jgi:uncharacterized membrane protein YhaH (DUF805 family)